MYGNFSIRSIHSYCLVISINTIITLYFLLNIIIIIIIINVSELYFCKYIGRRYHICLLFFKLLSFIIKKYYYFH